MGVAPTWTSSLIALQQPYLTIGRGFASAHGIPNGIRETPQPWWQAKGVGTAFRLAKAGDAGLWRASFFWSHEPLAPDFFPDKPLAEGSNVLDLRENQGSFVISGSPDDGGGTLLHFDSSFVRYDWQVRGSLGGRHDEVEVISVSFSPVDAGASAGRADGV